MDEETLKRLAAEALLDEAKSGAKRAAVMGPSGWVKKKESINKRFLNSTVRSVILSNKRTNSKRKLPLEINSSTKFAEHKENSKH